MAYDYFAGFPIAGETKEFLVTFASESDLDALAYAQAILLTCERDLDQLQAWFRTDYRAGSPHGIWVHVDSAGGGGMNFGYESDESSRIVVSGTFTRSPPVPNQAGIRDERACMIFVAELAEILMDFTGYGWNRRTSAGEALSTVMGTELHPVGYYASSLGPRVNAWLNASPRPDWVSATEGTDKNNISYGCGILFLYYLRYQNGVDYARIITAGGSTLAETYTRIFPGNPSNAFGGFAATLQAHVPVGTAVQVPRDNIFPLLDPRNRLVTLYEQTPTSADAGPAFGTRVVTRKAGPRCPPKDYSYETELMRVTDAFKANARGFLKAGFAWRIGGTPLGVHGKQAAATVPVTITDTALDAPGSIASTLDIGYIISDGQNQSTLQIRNDTFPGNLTLDIAVDAVESLMPGDAATTRDLTTALQLFDYRLNSQWGVDVFACNPRPILEIDQSIVEIADWVTVLLNTPDPAPEQVLQLAGVLQRYVENLATLTGEQRALVSSIRTTLASVRSARVAAGLGKVERRLRSDGPPIVFRDTDNSSRHHRHHRDHDHDD